MASRGRYDSLARLSAEDQQHVLTIAAARLKAAREAPPTTFLDYLQSVRIENATSHAIVPFELWDHLAQRASAWEGGQSEVILKARQLGISWLEAAFTAWKARQPNTRILILSQGEREAMELLRKVKLVNDYLTNASLRSTFAKSTNTEIIVKGGGHIMALPSTENAGRSFTASTVIIDEAAFHPFAAENFRAYFPTIADGGQAIFSSTSNGPSGFFFQLYQQAKSQTNGFNHVFIPPTARPDRDESWIADTRRSMGDEDFKREYPMTDDEAWVASAGLVFPTFAIATHVAPPPIAFKDCTVRVAGIDPGGDDPTVITIGGAYQLPGSGELRFAAYDHLYARRMTSVDEMASYLYRWPGLNAVYVDAPPKSPLIAQLRTLGIPAVAASKERGPGLMLMDRLIREQKLLISPSCRDGISEFFSYWYNPRSQVKYATITGEGHHGDFLDSLRYILMGIDQMVRQTLGSPGPNKPSYRRRGSRAS